MSLLGSINSTLKSVDYEAENTTKIEAPLAASDSIWPIPNYQFGLQINDITVALFQNISGISISREVEPLSVGGENYFGREFPGHISYGHLTLEAGLSHSKFFWEWMKNGEYIGRAYSYPITLVQRRPTPPDSSSSDVFEVIKRWDFFGAFPVSWKISDLGIENSDNIVLESLEVSFDYFELSDTSA